MRPQNSVREERFIFGSVLLGLSLVIASIFLAAVAASGGSNPLGDALPEDSDSGLQLIIPLALIGATGIVLMVANTDRRKRRLAHEI